jgi:hypothetical protein
MIRVLVTLVCWLFTLGLISVGMIAMTAAFLGVEPVDKQSRWRQEILNPRQAALLVVVGAGLQFVMMIGLLAK